MNKLFTEYLFIVLSLLLISCSKNDKHEYPEERIVDETRFNKVQLAGGLDEPMEIAISEDGRVVVVERKGGVKLYDPMKQQVSLIHTFNVFSGLEDGLLGVAMDPDHTSNNFIYFFYSPAGDAPIQRISRFILKGNQLDTLSEKIVIEIPTQRLECCHSAGSLAFGPDGNLFISVGDNTNPHNPGYYNSIDERKGREFWDAQRTAGNTDDLRGKILRIHVEPDGTYTIPEGNLFAPGDSLARPEIYAMGCRNPYRISLDHKRKWLFWGDVGQNTIDDPARGPISYDEWNVAREAGFFGWPYFAGPNAPYADFDFETKRIGPFFKVQEPENTSVNNSGRKTLPPAKGAMIWYSYDESEEFENLGTGGKSPIAGPVFYSDRYRRAKPDSSIALPSYYDGKLFIAEWLRDWINVVTLDEDGRVENIEPFMKHSAFSHPIELEIGPEGALYVLEYGTNWFSKNEEAALYRIGYVRGNRPPVVKLSADKVVGATPLTIGFSADGTFDPDTGSHLSYEWYFDQDEVQSREPNPTYQFKNKGIYTVRLMVQDEQGKQMSATTEVRAGNDMPVVLLNVEGNQSFYWDNKSILYAVGVEDKEDGSLQKGSIKDSDVALNLSYTTMGTDMALVEQSEELFNSSAPGWQSMKDSDCKACHALKDKSVGPTYLDIAKRYKNEKNNVENLAKKIISGGSGSWGENVMSAHPQLSREDAEGMVSFILSLKSAAESTRPLPLNGSFLPNLHLKDKSAGDYVLTATYQDKEVTAVGSNTVRKRVIFRNAEVNAISANGDKGVSKTVREVAFIQNGGWIMFSDIDLTDVKSMVFHTSSHRIGGALTARVNAPDGEEIARVSIQKEKRNPIQKPGGEMEFRWTAKQSPLKEKKGKHHIYILFEDDASGRASDSTALLLKSVKFNP